MSKKKQVVSRTPEDMKAIWLSGLSCSSCGKGERLHPHPCPFKIEIRGDEDTLCDCCKECRRDCAMEV